MCLCVRVREGGFCRKPACVREDACEDAFVRAKIRATVRACFRLCLRVASQDACEDNIIPWYSNSRVRQVACMFAGYDSVMRQIAAAASLLTLEAPCANALTLSHIHTVRTR